MKELYATILIPSDINVVSQPINLANPVPHGSPCLLRKQSMNIQLKITPMVQLKTV